MHHVKIYSSNFTFEEQNSSILKTLKDKSSFSFRGSSYSGFSSEENGLYFKSGFEASSERVLLAISSKYVKKIIDIALKNPIRRNVKIESGKRLIDLLTESDIEIESLYSEKEDFLFDLSFLEDFRINKKTCNTMSYLYFTKSYIIYHNIRGGKEALYTKKRRKV